MPDTFRDMINGLVLGDNDIVIKLKKNIETILWHHFSKLYIELDWLATDSKLNGRKIVFDEVFSALMIKVNEKEDAFGSFSDYKHYLISEAEKSVPKLFQTFFELLAKKDTNIWLVFDKILKKGYTIFYLIKA